MDAEVEEAGRVGGRGKTGLGDWGREGFGEGEEVQRESEKVGEDVASVDGVHRVGVFFLRRSWVSGLKEVFMRCETIET